MKTFGWILVIIGMLAIGVYFQRDSKWFNDLAVFAGIREAPIVLPLRKSLTDLEGREIDTEILGFSATEIAFRRVNTNQEFVIDLATLSQRDRDFFAKHESQGFSEIGRVKKFWYDQRFSDRHATWHRDIQMAKRDAGTIGLPLCLLMLRSDGNISAELDRFVIRSRKFRDWADKNVVLCLYYNDPGTRFVRKGLDSTSKAEAQDLAQRYGVGNRTPAFVVLNSDATWRGNLTGYGGEATEVVIKRLEEVLTKKTKSSKFSGD
ncbi:MAG: hypothetical protein KDN19_04240 [Verrucomicrobiae bacterium]|nr:hypothetical protein [Verrucomicrobiae bacterium]